MRQIKLLFDLNVDIRLSKEQCKIVMNHISELEGYIKEIETIHAICIRDKNYYRNQAKAPKHQEPTEE